MAQPATLQRFNGICWVLWTITNIASTTTFCPLTSPSGELIHVTDQPSQVFIPVQKTECAIRCAEASAQYGVIKDAVCRCFGFNEASSKCSIFNFEPSNYAVNQSEGSKTYQVSEE